MCVLVAKSMKSMQKTNAKMMLMRHDAYLGVQIDEIDAENKYNMDAKTVKKVKEGFGEWF